MGLLAAKVYYKGIVGMSAAQFKREYLNPVWQDVGRFWVQFIRPKHFTNAGGKEYGYRPRMGEPGSGAKYFKGSYTGRKLAKLGHTRPLVFKGDLERESGFSRIEPKRGGGCRVVLPRAQKANWRNTRSKNAAGVIDMRSELTAISSKDAQTIYFRVNKELARRLRNIPRSEVKVIK